MNRKVFKVYTESLSRLTDCIRYALYGVTATVRDRRKN